MENKANLTRSEKIQKIFLYIVFFLYILFLAKLLFLSRVSILELFDSQRRIRRSFNFIPFHSIKSYAFSNVNIYGNIAVFIPLGAYLMLFKKGKKVISSLLIIFVVSFSAELLQCLFGIGATDVDDIILNFTGGVIGVLGCKLFLHIFKEKKTYNIISIASLIELPFLLYILFFIKLRL